MDVIVRKVFRHGKSLAITLPRRWSVPEILNVYLDKSYIVYSPLAGLDSMYGLFKVDTVKRRIVRTGRDGKYTYYVVTIPKSVTTRLGITQGTIITVIRRIHSGEPLYIGLVGEEKLVKALSDYIDEIFKQTSYKYGGVR